MATQFSKPEDADFFCIRNAVVKALDTLDSDDNGWSYVIDVLVLYTINLTRGMGITHVAIGGAQAKDHVQDAICDFLAGNRTWKPPQPVDFDNHYAARNAFITFMKFVIKSIVRNTYRRASWTKNECCLAAKPGSDATPGLLDAREGDSTERTLKREQGKDHILFFFGEDEVATSVLETIIDMSLFSNAEIACELEVDTSVVKNAKRRIARRFVSLDDNHLTLKRPS